MLVVIRREGDGDGMVMVMVMVMEIENDAVFIDWSGVLPVCVDTIMMPFAKPLFLEMHWTQRGTV